MPFYLSPVFRRRDSRMLLHILAGIGYGRKTSRHKICLALQDLAVLLNENPLSSPGKLSLPCLSHPWFACFHFFARRKYELTTKSKRFSMIFIFIALSRPVSDKFAFHLPRNSCKSVSGSTSCRPPGTESPQKRSRCLSPPSTWHSVPADFLAAGSNLNGGAPSFRPDADRLQQGGEQAVSRNGPEKCCHVRKGRRNSCLLVSLSTG